MLNKYFPLSFFIIGIIIGQDEGIKNYNNNNFEAAQKFYESILLERGSDPEAQFGRGASLYQQGDLETAKQSFEETLKSTNSSLKAKAMYNLGNTFYQNQKVEEAIAFYRKAIELDPGDKEAKYNYEYLKYQQKPPEKEEQEQDQEQKEQDNQNQQEQPQQQEDSNEEAQDLKQAESILDALKQDEKIMQKKQIARSKSRKLAKDW